jgi:broad specificity phosphatase PhoE
MSYSLYDQDGWVAPVATAQGWKHLSGVLRSLGEECATLESQGYTTDPDAVAESAGHELPDLSKSLRKCHGIAIISDSLLDAQSNTARLSESPDSDNVLYVARHGETDDDTKGIASGWSKTELNRDGQKEIEQLARHLDGRGIAEIYASDLPRTMDSADIIASRIGAKVIPMSGLRSWHHGADGVDEKEAKPIIARGIKHPDKPPVPGAESRNEMAERFRDALQKIIARQKIIGKPVLIVTHSWNAGLIPLTLAGADEKKVKPLDPGQAEKLVYDGQTWDVEHLQDEMPAPYLVNGPTMPLAKPEQIDSATPGSFQQVFNRPEKHFRPSPMPSGDATDKAVVMQMSERRPPPEHFDSSGASETLDGHVIKLQKLLTGPLKAFTINAIVRQAIMQLKRGSSSTDLTFDSPAALAHKLLPSVDAIKQEAAKHARQEVMRMTKGRVNA